MKVEKSRIKEEHRQKECINYSKATEEFVKGGDHIVSHDYNEREDVCEDPKNADTCQ